MEDSSSPLTETTFFILFSLAISPRHGYSIIKEVEHLSDGRIKMAAGTLYGAIKRLLDCGWIERCEDEPENNDSDRERKSYRLSNTGRHLLQAELNRMQKIVKMAKDYTFGESI